MIQHEINEMIKKKVGINNDNFINTMIHYKMAQITTNMRMSAELIDGTKVPSNFYALNLAPSGFSKGKTINFLEDNIFGAFEHEFMEVYAPEVARAKLQSLAEDEAIQKGITEEDAMNSILNEWSKLPKHLYSFSSATMEGLKAKRRKLTMIDLGSTSLEIDEIAHNLEANSDVLGTMLEVFDMGKAKQKLIKVDSNSKTGSVPANLLMFGTPHRLLDGGVTEKTLMNKLREGYARRLFFGYIDGFDDMIQLTPEEEIEMMKSSDNKKVADELEEHFKSFASQEYLGRSIKVEEPEMVRIIEYRKECENKASELSEYNDLEKFELMHRYWKAIKLASIVSLMNKFDKVTMESIEYAIQQVEVSGENFKKMIDRPSNFERLYKYIVDSKKDLTQYDLIENLHFYSGNKGQKEEMLSLAQAFAYKQNAVIRRKFIDGIEFISGKELEQLDPNKIILSLSSDMTEGYESREGQWDNLYKVATSNINYSNHHFKDGYRKSDNAKHKFNLLIFDIDDGATIEVAKELFKDYQYLIATTKSHNKNKGGLVCHRYRLFLMPNKILELNTEDYSEFMANIMEDLPIEVDKACKDIARFFAGFEGAEYWYNEGEYFDVMPYIPNTSKNELRIKSNESVKDLTGLERYFAKNMSEGNRSNHFIRYGLVLVDNGYEYETVEDRILELNKKIDGLSEKELMSTVLKTVKKRIYERDVE